MRKDIKYSIDQLRNAFQRLTEGVELASDKLSRDGAIQRFEFTFELLWKALKTFLAYRGTEVNSPRECFKEIFKIGLIGEDEVFLDMLEDRNLTTHMYDQEVSEEIFERIKTIYVPAIQNLLKELVDFKNGLDSQ